MLNYEALKEFLNVRVAFLSRSPPLGGIYIERTGNYLSHNFTYCRFPLMASFGPGLSFFKSHFTELTTSEK